MPCSCAMPHIAAGSTAPPRWTCSSVSSSPSGCGIWPRRLAALLSRRRAPDPAATTRRGRSAFGMLAPNDVAVVVGRCDTHEEVPELATPDLVLGLAARRVLLEHDVAVVRRSDDLPAVLGEQIEEARDQREALGRLRDVLTKPP